jgi:hypothetical protein
MNRAALSTIGIVAFISGLILGVVVGRRSAERSEVSQPTPQGSVRPGPGKAITGMSSSGKSGTKETQEEMSRLRQRVSDLEARLSTVPPSEDEARKADEIYKHLRNPKIEEDPKGFMRATGLLADLKPTMTPIFAKKFRAAKPQFDGIALELALASGGPEAAALLKEILGSPSTQKGERVGVGISLTGEGYLLKLGTWIPVDPELANLGLSSLALTDPYERLAGVGVLGLQGTDQSRSALQGLAVQDKDEPVRIAALNALGRIGDRSTLEYLRSYTGSAFPDLSEESDLGDQPTPSAKRALLQALRQLSQRFPD